ncbi:MAG: hypothetical protein WAT66_08340 [Actinomycetota bacterium]
MRKIVQNLVLAGLLLIALTWSSVLAVIPPLQQLSPRFGPKW